MPHLPHSVPAAVLADLDWASDPQRHFGRADLLGGELKRLERLQRWAQRHGEGWRQAIHGRELGLGIWLYGIALGIAAMGHGRAALSLLEALPQIDGGAHGRRDLLAGLVEPLVDTAPSRAA
jgi:hypothetical protein